MKMLVMVYRDNLSEDIQQLLEENGVKTYSEIPRVFGMGEAGRIDDSRWREGSNSCIFAALPEEQIEHLNHAFREFIEKRKRNRGKALRVFTLNCEQLI